MLRQVSDPVYSCLLVGCLSHHQARQQLIKLPGITVGLVIVPQAMAYALLAELPPSYGLYTSFTGAMLYWLFGTSKDIVIGVSSHMGVKNPSW